VSSNTVSRFASLLAAASAALAPWAVAADDFVVDDVVISNPDVPIADPEFNAVDARMVWQSGDGDVWVADVDPATGLLTPRDGRGTLVGTNAAPLADTLNGPEWSYGSDGTFVVFTQDAGDVDWIAASREIAPNQWISNRLGKGGGRYSPVGSPPSNPGPASVIHNLLTQSGPVVQEFRDILNPDSRQLVDLPVSRGARWVEGRDLIVTSTLLSGVRQIAVQDVITGQRSVLGTGGGEKVLPFGWYAPELDSTLVVAKLGARRIVIYRDSGEGWEPYRIFTLPSPRPYVHSPEPFVYQGTSYLTIVAADDDAGVGGQPVGASDIWIANIDPAAPFFRQVSTSAQEGNRTDPEAFVLDSGPVIYYTQYLSGPNTYLLRRADTGL
jgi:hypothetical protein